MNNLKAALSLILVLFGLLACGEMGGGGNEDGETEDKAPVITSFTPDKTSGEAPLKVTFSWEISDPENKTLSCTLDFGDETQAASVDNCMNSSAQAHTYDGEGQYTAKLTVKDAKNTTSKDSAAISVSSNDGKPADPDDPSNPDGPDDPDTPSDPNDCDAGDNNTFAGACVIKLDTDYKGTIASEGDLDYFKVTVDNAGVLIMTLDPVPSEVRMRIVLYNDKQDKVTEIGVGNEGQARTLEQLVDAGTYYILVDNYVYRQSSADPYTLNVRFDTTDENEINNTFSDAQALTLVDGEVVTTGTIRSVNDLDYFQVTVDNAGVLIMTLDPVPSEVRMRIVLYNQQQNKVTEVGAGNVGQARTLEQLVDAGTYYILVDNYVYRQSSAETYTLKVVFDTTDENELNNTFSDATPLTIGSSVKGTIRSVNDLDYFKFELAQGGVVNFVLDPVPSSVRMRIVLYDQQQNAIVDSGVGNPGQPRSLSRELTAGTYYLLLDNYVYRQSSAETYTLATGFE